MEGQESNLVIKLSWANFVDEVKSSKIPFFKNCKTLEEEGFGMLADKNNPDRLDETNSVFSVVLPDNTVVSTKDIDAYIEKRQGHYSSLDPDDVKMHRVQMYYAGFILSHLH